MGKVKEIAADLVNLSLEAAPGSYLGSESDMLERLAVSRPTLRQAAKIVEADRLLQIRQGLRGGYYASRPDAADAIRAPARYLRLNGATISDVQSRTALVMAEAAAIAASSTSQSHRKDLQRLRSEMQGIDSASAMIRNEIDLARLIARMSGSPTAQLFIEIGYTFGEDERQGRLYQDADHRKRGLDLQRKLIDAILEGDGDIACLLARRRADLIASWLHEA